MFLCTACAVDPLTSKPVSEPEFHAKNVQRYVETVAGQEPETVLGYDLRIVGDDAKWRACAAVDDCGTMEHVRPAKELLGVERIASTFVADGTRNVDVLKLSLAARPAYAVPYVKTK